MEEKNSIMIFSVNGEKFGVKISDISEVNRVSKILPIHRMHEAVLGVINLHGKSTPVISLERLLELESETKEKDLFVALRTKSGTLCLLVDQLIGFEQVSQEEIRRPEDMALNFDETYLEFLYLKSNSMICVLDVNYFTEKVSENAGRASVAGSSQ